MKTRNIIKLGAIAACLAFASSCDIDRQPLTSYAADDFFQSETNAYMALIGCYHANITYGSEEYTPTDWWSYQGFIMTEYAADNAWNRKGEKANGCVFTDDSFTSSSNSYTTNLWKYAYKKIARCNKFLELIESYSGERTDNIKTYEAEGRFLRATQYFYLASFFHDVPLVTKTQTMQEANTVTKTKRSEVLAYALQEFKEAAQALPTWKNVEYGRASKQAALAFAGRIQLMNQDWEAAAATFKEIIDLKENELSTDYASLFLPSTADAQSENIFIARHDDNLCGSGFLYHVGACMIGGWSSLCVSGRLAEKYQFIDGSDFSYKSPLYDPKNIGANRDPRMAQTMYWNGCAFGKQTYNCDPDTNAAQGKDGIHASNQTTRSGYMLRKFVDDTYYDNGGDMCKYALKMPVIRYAEVLLSYVEAKNEAGTITEADFKYLNDIRDRATMPRYEFSKDQATTRKQVRFERDIEMALEGLRLWDLYRWGTICETISGDYWGASFPGSKAVATRNAAVGKTDPLGMDRWYIGVRTYTKAKAWCIPQSEIDINPNLGVDL